MQNEGLKTPSSGDEPGCGNGGTQRMLEIPDLGHPYINAPNVRNLNLNILKDRIESHLIKPKCQDTLFDTVIDKIKKLENKRVLEYIQQRISDILDLELYDEENKIVLSEIEEQQYKNVITFPPEQIEHFLNGARLWFSAERIDKQHEEKLKLNILGNTDSDFLNKKHDSCADFIIYCCQDENILQVGPKVINDAVNCRLSTLYLNNASSQQPTMLNHFNNLNSHVANEGECGKKRAREEEISLFNKRRK